jgi:superfamily II DNA/RNA helicase
LILTEETPGFSELGLSPKVLKAVEKAGYDKPTPIQAQAIPHALQRKDVLGIAQTGTGKTASFTLPMLTLLEKGRARARMPRSLVIAPTRELASQVYDNLVVYGANHNYTVALLIGGVAFGDQDKKLTKGADILIATPGRLLDHFERGKLLLTGIEILVIDEADRMLDMGFIPDIEKIFSLTPITRQTLFFSATMPDEIQRIVNTFLHQPVRVEASSPATTATTITQKLVASGPKDYDKRATLRRLLDEAKDMKNAIVFCNRKRDVATLERSLKRHNYNAGALHGDMDQSARTETLKKFKNNEIQILVASDVAARGLDIPDVSHVYNFDLPGNSDDYVHRIGRTGRAGREGAAFSLVTVRDDKVLDDIEKIIHQKLVFHGPNLSELAEAETSGEEDEQKNRRSSRKKKSKEVSSSETSPSSDKPSSRRRKHQEANDNALSDDAVPFEQTDFVPAFLKG